MNKAISIENTSKNVVRVLSIADALIIENNPTGSEYILITDYTEPPVLNNVLSINYPMYDKSKKQFKWVEVQYQNTATEEMFEIENLKSEVGLVQNSVNKIDTKVFPVADKSTMSAYKQYKIKESKDLLVEYLENNPILFTDGNHYSVTDGNHYSVTEKKQNLLANTLTVHQLKLQAGIASELKWNATGEECIVWTLENLTMLALAIADYVAPLVAKQQTFEVTINSCITTEELDTINISYEQAT